MWCVYIRARVKVRASRRGCPCVCRGSDCPQLGALTGGLRRPDLTPTGHTDRMGRGQGLQPDRVLSAGSAARQRSSRIQEKIERLLISAPPGPEEVSPWVNRTYECSLPSKSPTRVAAGAHASRDRRERGFWQEASTQCKKLTTVYFQSPESVFGVTVTDFTSTYDATPYSTANWLCFKVSNFKDIQMVSVCPIF